MHLTHWIISVLAILIASYLIPGIYVTLIGAVVLAVVLAVINTFIKPVLKLLTFPITLLTLGLFSLVLNALLIMFAAWLIPDPGFAVSGFWPAFFFGIVMSLVNAVLHHHRR